MRIFAVCKKEHHRFWNLGDIQLDKSELGMHAYKHVHDKLSCTHLQNYTIVYTNMVAVTKSTAKNNKTTTSATKTT